MFYSSVFFVGYKWHAFFIHQDVHCEECQLLLNTFRSQMFILPVGSAYISGSICRENEIILWSELCISNGLLCRCVVQVLNLSQCSDSGTLLSHLSRSVSWRRQPGSLKHQHANLECIVVCVDLVTARDMEPFPWLYLILTHSSDRASTNIISARLLTHPLSTA